jgi:hypothetical protein
MGMKTTAREECSSQIMVDSLADSGIFLVADWETGLLREQLTSQN